MTEPMTHAGGTSMAPASTPAAAPAQTPELVPEPAATPVLEVEGLSVSFSMYDPRAPFFSARRVESFALRSLSLAVGAGELVAVMGSSGSGKSVLADAILGMHESNAHVAGTIRFMGDPRTPEELAALAGRGISLVPQGVGSLDPLMRVGRQVAGGIRHGRGSRADANRRLERVREIFNDLDLAPEVMDMYPHELSGGMARRVLLACALIDDPVLLVADEPTPGLELDLAVRALDGLRAFADRGGAVLLVTHDIELALRVADRIAVVADGTVVEEAPVERFASPDLLEHPFSRALWHALPEHDFAGGGADGAQGR